MKQSIHPEYVKAKVRCNGCGTEFETRSTTPDIVVEICSACHPFYTGKQKLVDTAGRVDKFKARQQAAEKLKTLTQNTVDMPAESAGKDQSIKPAENAEQTEQ